MTDWISVDERLPEPYTNVLTTDGEGEPVTGMWRDDIGWESFYNPFVTHWMPLPRPPVSLLDRSKKIAHAFDVPHSIVGPPTPDTYKTSEAAFDAIAELIAEHVGEGVPVEPLKNWYKRISRMEPWSLDLSPAMILHHQPALALTSGPVTFEGNLPATIHLKAPLPVRLRDGDRLLLVDGMEFGRALSLRADDCLEGHTVVYASAVKLDRDGTAHFEGDSFLFFDPLTSDARTEST